jgi:hypothetical protein
MSLLNKIRLFEEHGKITYMEDEIFMHQHWAAKFIGLNLWPKNYDLFLDKLDFSDLLQNFDRMHQAMVHAVPQMPSHKEYLQSGLN